MCLLWDSIEGCQNSEYLYEQDCMESLLVVRNLNQSHSEIV
jgi:hypothetical protein